jgi:CheY-like chemotaxis protein
LSLSVTEGFTYPTPGHRWYAVCLHISVVMSGQIRKNILVVEDTLHDFVLLECAFIRANLGHRLIHLQNGAEAVSYLRGGPPFSDRRQWPTPDLLLLDGKLPGMSGFDILRFVVSNSEFLFPVVMLTGSGIPGEAYTATDLGACEYLSKPENPSELTVLVQTIHHRWLAH